MTVRRLVQGLLSLFALAILGSFYFDHPTLAKQGGPILARSPYYTPQNAPAYRNNMMSGGPPKDGIPSIDNPKFIDAKKASQDLLQPGDIVIGYAGSGQAKAYPQKILVQHEIVNDVVGDEKVSITYCPLTATAQGFKRGSTTMGVSGRLINSNLVMYDRATDSFFPQILATGIKGKLTGKTLKELNVVWTTWKRWKNEYPNTRVMSDQTGFLRSYSRDPYGSYNPKGGYYARDRVMFPLMNSPVTHDAKKMIIGARTEQRSVYFPMEKLRNQRVLRTEHFLVVYDTVLDTGYIYLQGSRQTPVQPVESNQYQHRGKLYGPKNLPLEKLVSIEGFYFAWNAFYPQSETI